MTKSFCCLDGRAASAALLRWGLGLLLLVSGLRKLPALTGFVNGYILPAFADTLLPAPLTAAYAYALPPVEALLGALLILGLFRNASLLLAGLTFLSLAFGQMLLQNHAVVFQIMGYLALTAGALCLEAQDRWIVKTPGCPRAAAG